MKEISKDCELVFNYTPDKKGYTVVPLKVGTKIECRDFILEKIKNEPFIQDNFKLNVKRLNRWWYSVYFAEICNHNYDILDFGESKYCSHCKERINNITIKGEEINE